MIAKAFDGKCIEHKNDGNEQSRSTFKVLDHIYGIR